MASKVVGPYSATVTGASHSIATVGSTTGLLAGMVGTIALSGQTTRRIVCQQVIDSTHFQAAYFPQIADDNFDRNSSASGSDAGYPANTSGGDISAYTGGSATVYFEAQLAYDPSLR